MGAVVAAAAAEMRRTGRCGGGGGGGGEKKGAKEEGVVVAAEAAAERGRRLRLVGYDELPDFLRDNEFIRGYYRAEWPLRDAALSAFSWHNETLNVWTHLGGFLLFLALALAGAAGDAAGDVAPGIIRFVVGSTNASWQTNDHSGAASHDAAAAAAAAAVLGGVHGVPRWPRMVFLVGAMTCLAISATAHLLACHSRRASVVFWQLDYAGISAMIVASFVPPVYYAFLCHRPARVAYLSAISALGALVVGALLSPPCSSPRFRRLRAALFLAMGLSGVVPALHALWLNWGHAACYLALSLEVAMGLAYAAGAWFYVSRVPEKWRPGVFDVVGHSHQIFHVLVLVGAVTHYVAVDVLLNWRETVAAACSATS
uniref:Uncharacterized protein n=1 Tax=Oryza nivara TaxID=4536 RepID=A0A0E0G2I1_ORYNI